MSLFRRKKSSSKLKQPTPEPPPFSPPSSPLHSTLLPPASPSTVDFRSLHIDDFGRPVEAVPAFAAGSGGGGAPFGSGFGAGEDDPPAEMMLLYGYAPLSTTLELSIVNVEEIVARCSQEIRQRGLDTPLIMSSMALDLSLEGVCSLIRSYLDSPQTWAHDLTLSSPLSVGAFLKWGLGRLVNDRGARGFVSWDLYSDFKTAERATGYQPKSCTVHLISRLSAANGRLLAALLSLFSSLAAHAPANGMPPRKLAALFSPYVFGLADDRTFDETYEEWQRATDAFEHIILAFIRDQQADEPLPTFLERFVVGYPATLNVSCKPGEPPKVPKGARIEEVTRFKRLTRFHSRNLIQQSRTWEIPHSANWKLFFDHTNPSSTPVYTASYRHLLNIRSNHGLADDGDLVDDGEMQKHKTMVEKEWSKFGDIGFADVDSKRLEFDLTEGERPVLQKRDTLDWSTFESSGFAGREIFAATDLVFHQSINQRVTTWPSSQKALSEKLRATEQLLPPFPYDTTPREEGRRLVEKDFLEAWADVLVGGGWARDELKESSFALIQFKARPRDGELPKGKMVGTDPRTEERWIAMEEYVPREYREQLLAHPQAKKQSKRVSFMRAVRRKSTQKAPPPAPSSRPSVTGQPSFSSLVPAPLSSSSYHRKDSGLRPIDEAVFQPDAPYETQHLSLSNLHGGRGPYAVSSTYAASTAYAPSIVSTVRAADGHGPAYSTSDLATTEQYPPPVSSPGRGAGVGGTLSSQPRESAFGGQGVPVALSYSRPEAPQKKGSFLSRIGTMRPSGKSNGSSLAATTAPDALAAQHAPASQVYPRASPPRPQAHVSSVAHSPAPAPFGNGGGVPTGEPHRNGVLPGQPPLAPVVERSEATPPLPPKENGRTGTPLTNYSRSSASTVSAASDDPYGGLDDSEGGENAEVGEVLFRGSQSYPRNLHVQAGVRSRRPSLPLDGQAVEQPASPPRRVPVPLSPPTKRQPRFHSLPDSPKPEAEVPVDELDPRFPSQDRYLSGVSAFDSRVASIVGLYENGNTNASPSRSPGADVRLTQFGFAPQSAPSPPLPDMPRA
ncbi:hypothetical protein JCM10213_008758 [Rhodosporidiobolus nylandii]